MKKSIQIIATTFAILLGNVGYSQNDTMYVMKNGVVINKQSVKSSDIDSIIFYNPNSIDTTNNSTITDADGNVYTSVTIGTQEWMVENLRTTKYSDGTVIPNVTGNTEWANLSTGAWCHYDNDNQYDTVYGKLYNWYAVETGKLCPTGWHVPTDAEWTVLTDYLTANGHNGAEGTALKAISGWDSDGNGTDDYGWLGFPGGYRTHTGYGLDLVFNDISRFGYWWSSLEADSGNAFYRDLRNYSNSVHSGNFFKFMGFSVRCIKN